LEKSLAIVKNNFLSRGKISVSLILALTILIMFIGDAFSKYLVYKESSFTGVSLFLRFIFESIVLVTIAKNITKIQNNNLILLVLLSVFYLIGQTILLHNVNYTYNIIANLILYNKYIYIFIVFIFLKYLTFSFNNIERILYIIFIFNAIFILIGVIFEVELFKTAIGKEYRFGYNGLISASANESAFIIVLSIIFFYFKTFFIEKKISLSFIFIIITSLFVGQKTIYLFLLLLTIYHILHFLTIKNIPKYSLIFFATTYIAILFFNSEEFDIYFSYFIYAIDKFDFITMLLGGRNDIILKEFPEVISNWNILNLFIGGRDNELYIMESEYLDLFLSFGILGTIIYLFVFYNLYIYKIKHSFLKFMLFSLLLIAMFSGHFFTSAVTALYFNFIYLFIYEKDET